MLFLPTLKRLENVLKSYMYCICFVCVGKCFCVALLFSIFATADLVGRFYVSRVDQREFVKCFLKVP